MKKRDARIELFRTLCIFGVCFLHALEQGGYAGSHRGLDNLLMSSVVGFIFISGWFGIRLRLSHILRLLGIGVYCAIVPVVLFDWFYQDHSEFRYLLSRFWCYYREPWFLWMYFALMLIAPTFDALFETDDRRKLLVRVLPVVFLSFGWSYAATKIPILKDFLPGVGGFGPFSLLTFIGIYLSARTCRVCEVERLLSIKILLFSALLSGSVCWAGLGHYCSPAAVIFAGTAFLLVRKLPAPQKIMDRCIVWLSPTIFSIYLLHRQAMGMFVMQSIEDALIGKDGYNYYIVCFLCACTFFFGAIVLDLPRRFVVGLVRYYFVSRQRDAEKGIPVANEPNMIQYRNRKEC